MAGKSTKKKAQASDAARQGHNRKGIIRDTCRQVAEIEDRIEALSAKRREVVNTNIKGLLDMKVANFNAALRLYRLDGADRDAMIDAVVETFTALGKGKQMDFFKDLKGEPEAPPPGGNGHDDDTAKAV